MCGIAVILKSVSTSCPSTVLHRMRDAVAYRGPDDSGSVFFRRSGSTWTEVFPSCSDWEIGLGHRRLSILDLSPAGHQPMGYGNRFWIVYNGEVYNFIELRAELERLGHSFRSQSDTEVILAAYAEWGPNCFARFRGMWGLVILDHARNEAILCRDRLGIKPLYLWQGSGIVAIASEIKQFQYVPGFTARLDTAVADGYIQTSHEDPRRSFFRGVQPVPAGSWFRIFLGSLKPSTPQDYWYPERVRATVTDAGEAGRLFAAKAVECVRLHLRSDVPVGCWLSGGLDSSSIAVLIDQQKNGGGSPLRTFTATFPGDTADEREYVNAVLTQIKASPHFVTPEPGLFLEELDRFLWVHDEPIGGISMYAGYCVARLTREMGVPVTLNGQGGDEIFSGYWQSYFLQLYELWKQRRLGSLASQFIGALLGTGNPALISQIPFIVRRYRDRRKPAVRLHGRNGSIRSTNLLDEILNLDGQARRVYEVRTMHLPRLLRWDDRNSMAFSIEGRYPFLDHQLIELCLSFAPETLYKQGWTKYPLRLGFKDYLPKKIVRRRSKFGFEVPQDGWLCGPLRSEIQKWLRVDRPVWDYIERKNVKSLAERVWQSKGRQEEPGRALFRIFALDRWLELFQVQRRDDQWPTHDSNAIGQDQYPSSL
jgi:asparagine synthase (glutamine-hydrolysing)